MKNMTRPKDIKVQNQKISAYSMYSPLQITNFIISLCQKNIIFVASSMFSWTSKATARESYAADFMTPADHWTV